MATDRVIDASSLVDALTIKDEAASKIRTRLKELTCHAPHLLDAEVGSVLRRKALRGELTGSQAHGLLRMVSSIVGQRYPHHGPLVDAAWNLRDNLSFSDALYVALAARLDIPLLTSDQRLANAPGLPCTIEIPGTAPST